MIRFENLGYKYTADEIIEYYSAPPVNEYFVSFCENLIEELRQIGKIRTTETYTTTLNSFKRFMNFRKKGRDIPFDNIDSNLMMEYEQYLKSNDICPNSTSYYMRNLRAMYNRAVEKELVIQRYPFKHVYTGIDKTVKTGSSGQNYPTDTRYGFKSRLLFGICKRPIYVQFLYPRDVIYRHGLSKEK